MTPQSGEFQRALEQRLVRARREGETYVEVNAGELHRQVGGYPGSDHRMPACCQVMRSNMRDSDEVTASTPSGDGATLTVRYRVV